MDSWRRADHRGDEAALTGDAFGEAMYGVCLLRVLPRQVSEASRVRADEIVMWLNKAIAQCGKDGEIATAALKEVSPVLTPHLRR